MDIPLDKQFYWQVVETVASILRRVFVLFQKAGSLFSTLGYLNIWGDNTKFWKTLHPISIFVGKRFPTIRLPRIYGF